MLVLVGRRSTHIGMQSRVWQWVPCSQRADEDARLPTKDSQNSRKRLSSGKRCVFLEKYKLTITAEMPNKKEQLVEKIDEINGQSKIRQMLGETHAVLRKSLPKKHGSIVHQRSPGAFRSGNSAELALSAIFSKKIFSRNESRSVLGKFETAIPYGGLA